MKRNQFGRVSMVCALTCVLIGCAFQPDSPSTPDAGNGDVVDGDLVVFVDPDSAFSTTSVRDVDEQIVRFDGVAKTMKWVEGNVEFTGWETDGNFLGAAKNFQVRFGTVGGEPRAYFTETGPATICDIEVVDGMLSIRPTSVTVPMN